MLRHLAGRLGVTLFDALAEAGAIVPEDDSVRLGEGAEAALARFVTPEGAREPAVLLGPDAVRP